MKKKIIISSILTIAICLGVITGSTFALFTMKSETNIAVTAGKIDVSAKIDTAQTTYTNGAMDTASGKWTFENGGTATQTSSTLVLDNITPGDGATVKIKINNSSNVAIKYVVVCKVNKNALGTVLDVKVDGHSVPSNSGVYQTTWSVWSSSAPLEVTLSVKLPESVTTAQGVSSDITFAVYAIQANAPAADANAWLAGQIG